MNTSKMAKNGHSVSQDSGLPKNVDGFTAAFVLKYCHDRISVNQIMEIEDVLYAYYRNDWDSIERLLGVNERNSCAYETDSVLVPASTLVKPSMKVVDSLRKERKLSRK